MSLEDRKWHIEQCIRCHNLQVYARFPRARNTRDLPAIQYGEFHAYSASAKIITAYGLMTGKADYSKKH